MWKKLNLLLSEKYFCFNLLRHSKIKLALMSFVNCWDIGEELFYLTMGQTLSEPITQKTTSCTRNSLFEVASSSMQGWRLTMEDTHVQMLDLPEDTGTSYFAVFDGHGGPAVAKFAGQNLHRYVMKRPEYKIDTEQALKMGFLDCDAELLSTNSSEEVGSTAVVILIKNSHIYCANLGDSRAVACISGKCVPLSQDHKPNNEEEKRRINNAGCWVTANRVNGNLALSRALGDFVFKRTPNKARHEQAVIALPDVQSHALTENWDFVVLACDGIWDVMPSEDVIRFCRDRIGRLMPVEKICEELLDYCISPTVPVTGSGGDNMTVILVCFLHNQGYAELAQRCGRKDDRFVGDMGPSSSAILPNGADNSEARVSRRGNARSNPYMNF